MMMEIQRTRVIRKVFVGACLTPLLLFTNAPALAQLRQPISSPTGAFPPLPNPAPELQRSAIPLVQPPPTLPEVTADELTTSPLPAASSSPTTSPIVPAAVATPTAPAEPVTAERLAESMKRVRELPELADEVEADILKRYQAALDSLTAVEEARRKIAQFEADGQSSSEKVDNAKALLNEPLPDPARMVQGEKSVAELETLLLEAENRLTVARAKQTEADAELKNRADRKAELAKRVEELQKRLKATEEELALPPPEGELGELTLARRAELQARLIHLKTQLDLCAAETSRSDKLAAFFPLQRDLAIRDTNILEKQVAHVRGLVDRARRLESERQAKEARQRAKNADPAFRELAEHNAVLAEQRQEISKKVTSVSKEVVDLSKRLTKLNEDFEDAQMRVQKAGHSSTVGLMLRRQRESLPSTYRCEQRLNFVEHETPVANLASLEWDEQREELSDVDEAEAIVMRSIDETLSRMHGDDVRQSVRELLSTKRQLLDSLYEDTEAYLKALAELEVKNREVIERSDEFRAFIDEHVLWIRSADPLRLSSARQVAAGAVALANPAPWLKLVRFSGVDALREPAMAVAATVAFCLLLLLNATMQRKIRALCQTKSNSMGWRFMPSLHALGLTACATAGVPLILAYVGWRMTSADRTTELGMALGPALVYAATLLWLSAFLRSLCRREGVAETFFSWPASSMSTARHGLRWLTGVGVPLAIVVVFTIEYEQGEYGDTVGRMAFVTAQLLLMLFNHSILGSGHNIFRESLARDSNGWLRRVRWVAYSAGVAVPAFLLVLAVIGYYYSAQQLAGRFQATLALSLALLLVHAVVSRWFLIKRRRLSMEQTRERQQQQQAATQESTDTATTLPPVQTEQTDWADVHERLRLLLQHAMTFAFICGTLLIWADVLPALKALDSVKLWDQTVEITEVYLDENGEPIETTQRRMEVTTIRHALMAILFLVGTFILGKNLPALLEITILNRLPLDRGGRHAASVIINYSVALAGVLLALRTLHINWSSVQWLAAAMTVGLGFGLQEIFANFVSGMILLFERPIRVGDIITLDDVTGTVTNIRIRATTVTNWDRKELIVPNKDLITGRLLNWTLTDTTNRIVINVGLAYDTDSDQAREVLMDTVKAHPNILNDPAPAVTFESFGDSTLNFVIRGYLSSLENRLETVHQLHSSIHKRLGEAGMEIAFPQRDINVRHISLPAQMFGGETKARRSDAA